MPKAAAPTARTRDAPSGRPHAAAWRFLPLCVVVAGLGVFYAAGWQRYLTLAYLGGSQDHLRALVAAHPLVAPLSYVAIYALAVAFSFPAASVLTIVGGYLFGWALGAGLAVVAASAGATALFLAARTAFGDGLKRRLGGFSARLAEGFEADPFTFLLVLRLAPFIPFVVVNIAPALFQVRLRTFIAATAIGIVPGAIAYAWLGEGLGSVLKAAAGSHVQVGDLVTPEISIAFAGLALIALVAGILKRRWKGGRRASRDG